MSEKLLEKVFSIKNDKDGKHKVVRVLGTKLKVKKTGFNKLKCLNLKEKISDFLIMHDKSLDVGIPDDLTLQLSFNSDCNCRCKFCFEFATRQEAEIIPEKWLYDYLVPLYSKTSNLVPTYGEITFRKEGYDYISYINKNYPAINILLESNGISFSRKWAELACENLMRVNFSVNAVSEEYFKKTVWEKDGVFTLVQNNIKQYLELLKEKDLFAFKPSISCVLNSSNYETVEDFIKMALGMGLQQITFFFDNLLNANLQDKEGFLGAITTIAEIEKLTKGRIMLYYTMFLPEFDFDSLKKEIEQKSMDDLKSKYPEIDKLSENMSIEKLFEERKQLRAKHNKKHYSYYEEVTSVTYHQMDYKGRIICENPWKHLRLRPNGDFEVCCLRGYNNNVKLTDFIKNDSIDWKKFFNSLVYKKLRKNFINGNYHGCMNCCPARESVPTKDFSEQYKGDF